MLTKQITTLLFFLLISSNLGYADTDKFSGEFSILNKTDYEAVDIGLKSSLKLNDNTDLRFKGDYDKNDTQKEGVPKRTPCCPC